MTGEGWVGGYGGAVASIRSCCLGLARLQAMHFWPNHSGSELSAPDEKRSTGYVVISNGNKGHPIPSPVVLKGQALLKLLGLVAKEDLPDGSL